MTPNIDHIFDALYGFERGVFQFNNPVSSSDIKALESRLPSPLPPLWPILLARHDGFDLRGDRYFGAAESLARWVRWQQDERPRYASLSNWTGPPPANLLPVATDLEGNLKCIDLLTHQIWDWHSESGRLTLWFTRPEHLVLCGVETLSLRFDTSGRPKGLSARRQAALVRDELLIHVKYEPSVPYAQLELAHWFERFGTPEDALLCFQRAAYSSIPTVEAFFEYGRFCVLRGKYADARRAFRQAHAVIVEENPLKHQPPSGVLLAAHRILERLYANVGQSALADAQRQAASQLLKREGAGWYGETEAYRDVMNIVG